MMAKRIKSKKYTGVYYRELTNGDRAFEFTYKDLEGKKKWVKVGLESHNINEAYTNRKRIETISKLKLDGDEPDFIKKRKEGKLPITDPTMTRFNISLQGGVDYMLTDKYFLNFDIKKLFLKTDVDVDASNAVPGATSVPAKVNIDPLLIGFGVGMKF